MKNIVEKGENAGEKMLVTSIFSFSPPCFLSLERSPFDQNNLVCSGLTLNGEVFISKYKVIT